jgi:hypothetical protein
MMSKILRSIKGRLVGLGHRGELIVNNSNDEQFGLVAFKTVTSAQLLALNNAPIELVAAPDAGFAHVVRRVIVHKPAGTAYAGIAAGEDLTVKYTNGSGALAAGQIETTGFLDQTTAETRVVGFIGASGTTSGDVEPVSAAALVAHLLVGEITTGDSPLHFRVEYDTIKLAVTA